MAMTIRRGTSDDLPFLAEMLVEAAYPPWTDPKPTPAEALADPHAGRYLSGWGRAGDVALIAHDDAGRRLGAAWCRRFPADEPGYGFVADDVPEVAIAVVAARRGQGIGRRLLEALIEAARTSGEHALSLSVSRRNPVAARLYESIGFVQVAGTDELRILELMLAASSAQSNAKPV